jgi:hypothetical protein
MLVSERQLSEASIDGATITMSGLAFYAVVMPSVTVLESAETRRALTRFKAADGMIWKSGDALKAICDESPVGDTLSGTSYLQGPPAEADIAELVARLPLAGPQITVSPARTLWRWVGQDEDGWWRIVVFNDGSESLEVGISLEDGFVCEFWWPADGTVEPVGAVRRLDIILHPHEVRCVRLRQTASTGADLHIGGLEQTDQRNILTLEDGWSFSPEGSQAFVPISVDAGWEVQGHSAFSGTGLYRCSVAIGCEGEWVLDLGEVHTAVTVCLGGQEIGRRAWRPYRFLLGHLSQGRHELELAVSNTAANRYYAGTPYQGDVPDKSGLTTPPRLILLTNRH